jgi:peptidoglycan hydrolase-like protein with peptidoglycan-binding domain
MISVKEEAHTCGRERDDGQVALARNDEPRPLDRRTERRHAVGVRKVRVDGSFGTGTKSAVKTFERKNGLPAVGVVGSATWRALVS